LGEIEKADETREKRHTHKSKNFWVAIGRAAETYMAYGRSQPPSKLK